MSVNFRKCQIFSGCQMNQISCGSTLGLRVSFFVCAAVLHARRKEDTRKLPCSKLQSFSQKDLGECFHLRQQGS